MTGWGGEGMVVRSGNRHRLDHVTVWFPAGAVSVLLGPNGSGKSTLLQVLGGLVRPDAGLVAEGTVQGWREAQWSRQVSAAGFSEPQDVPFCVEEILLSSEFATAGRWVDPSPQRRARLVDHLEQLEVFSEGTTVGLQRDYTTLSAGERQLVSVLRAVLQATPVLLLDEPVSALDLRHRLLVHRLLATEAKKGRTVILSLHDIDQIDAEVNHAVVLCRGQKVADGPPRTILNEELLKSVWGVAPSPQGYRLL